MRVVVRLLACLVLGVIALARPIPALACTGCQEPLADIVRNADRVLVATVASGSQSSGYRFTVAMVLMGDAASAVSFAPSVRRDYPVGSRWILVLYPGHGLDTVNAWQVRPDGRLISPGPFDAPTTLAGFIAFFQAPATDTTAAPDRAPNVGEPAALGAVFLVGFGLAARKLGMKARSKGVASAQASSQARSADAHSRAPIEEDQQTMTLPEASRRRGRNSALPRTGERSSIVRRSGRRAKAVLV